MLKLTAETAKKPKSLSSELLCITPEIAAAWLDKNIGNRKPSPSIVDSYARDMAARSWPVTGDAIRFDATGRLIDGQHRLMACVKSGAPFESMVVYGLAAGVQDKIDSGKGRRIGDMLSLKGFHNTNMLSGALRLVHSQRTQRSVGKNNVVTHAEALAILDKHPALPASVREARGAVGPSIAALAYVHYVGSHILNLPDRADAFVRVFKTGVPDYDGCPAHRLRERLMRSSTEVIRPEQAIRALFHVWNLFAKRKHMSQLRWPPDAEIENLDYNRL